MNPAFLRHSVAAATLAVVMVTSPAAHAQAVRDKVIELMRAELTAMKAKDIKFSNVGGSDEKFTVEEITATIPDNEKEMSLTITNATFVGAKPNAEGSYSAAEISAESIDIEGEAITLSAAAVKIVNYNGLSDAARAQGRLETFDRIELNDLEFVEGDKVTVPIESVALTASGHMNGIPRKSSIAITGVTVPFESMDDSGKSFQDLGYKEATFDLAVSGAWDEAAARLSVDNFLLKGKDIGTLSFSFGLGSVTADAIKGLQAAKDDSAKQMEILQGFSVESVAIRFDNASIVERVLDFQAKEAGSKRDQYVVGIAAAVPLMIQAINNKPFEKKIADAVGTFLKEPKSLAITAKPAQPVPVAQIVGTALVAPQTIPNVLSVEIDANK